MPIYTSEAFVYCWTNLNNGKKYIGYHKGTVSDGYICSSKSEMFWTDWKKDRWSRQILYEGTVEDCVSLEFNILQAIDLSSDEYYNNNVGGGIVYTDEVREKISKIHKGKIVSEETRALISKNNARYWNGKSLPEETRRKMSEAHKGKIISEETRRKMRESALHRSKKN